MAKNKMGACMSEWTSEHPRGRSKKKMNKKEAHRQAVAACLNKTGMNENQKFAPSKFMKSAHAQTQTTCPSCGKRAHKHDLRKHKETGKIICPRCPELNESRFTLSFKQYLVEADNIGVRDYIRSQPMYQELLKNPQSKPQALTLARSFVQEFGDGPVDANVQSYITDEFDDLYRNTFKQGANIGDWAGERDYQERKQQEKDIESAMGKWERATGMDAETGKEIAPHDQRGRIRHGARVGMEFRPEVKQQRIARELSGMGDERPEVQKRAAAGLTRDDAAYAGGESKASMARSIVADGIREGKRPAEIKQQLRDQLDMTAAGANTYYYKYKAMALANK
jgi:hypothetical protein